MKNGSKPGAVSWFQAALSQGGKGADIAIADICNHLGSLRVVVHVRYSTKIQGPHGQYI